MFRKSCFPSGSEGKESTCKVASVYLIHCLSFIVGKLNWKIALIKEKQFVTILTDTTNTGMSTKKTNKQCGCKRAFRNPAAQARVRDSLSPVMTCASSFQRHSPRKTSALGLKNFNKVTHSSLGFQIDH